MPLPKPQYQPSFTAEQLAKARTVAQQRSAPAAAVQRAKLTLLLAEHPELPHAEVGRRCGLDGFTVYKWRRRGQRGWSLDDAPRSGRPRSLSP